MTSAPSDYQVVLDAFRGPLDLLLYLVKRDEIDILDIPIAHIAEQFQQHLDTLIDVERAGDFLVMAASLMEIKSKLLLPRPAARPDEPEEDPRRELVRQLLQYKRVKEAASALDERAALHGLRFARSPVVGAEQARRSGPAPLKPVELWDLVSAFGRLLRETLSSQPHVVVEDHTPLHVHIAFVLAQLEQGPATLAMLFVPPHTRSRLVGLFLAILELAKMQRIETAQDEVGGDIRVRLLPEPPAG